MNSVHEAEEEEEEEKKKRKQKVNQKKKIRSVHCVKRTKLYINKNLPFQPHQNQS